METRNSQLITRSPTNDRDLYLDYGLRRTSGRSPQLGRSPISYFPPVNNNPLTKYRCATKNNTTSNYARGASRIFDSFIFWGNTEHDYSMRSVTQLRQASAYGIQVADLNHDGWLDICYSNHSTGGNHRTDSPIHWNRQGRFTDDDVTLLPTLGPHMSIAADLGNAYTRKLEESWVSEPFEKPRRSRYRRLSWEAETRFGTSGVFKVRTAENRDRLEAAAWTGPHGPDTFFMKSGADLGTLPADESWIQYRAVLRTPNGAATPILTRVDVDYE